MKNFFNLGKYTILLITSFLCVLFETSVSAQPVIGSFTPMQGPAGTIVTINGFGFSANLKSNHVYFGAVKALVLSADSNVITVQAPAGATYKPLSVTTHKRTAYSNEPFIVTFGSDTINEASFAGKVDFISGRFAESLTNADIDGDKKADILVTNYSDNTVSVFRNISSRDNIALDPPITITGLNGPGDIFTGDVDGDGKLDMIVVYLTARTLSIYRNTSVRGHVSFADRVDYVTGIYPIFGAIGDLNADGKPDIAIANNQTNTVSVYTNQSTPGEILLTAAKNFPTGSGPQAVSIADFNGDSKPDLAVTNYFSNSVSILKNASSNKTISFSKMESFPVGTNPYHMAVGDLNGDGEPDIVTANTFGNSISVLKNSKGKEIAFDTKMDFPMPNNVESVNLGDLNGDGKPDIAVAGSDASIAVLQNISSKNSIKFLDNQYFHLPGSSSYVAIGDEDGDAKPELIVGYLGRVAVFRNQMSSDFIASTDKLTSFNVENISTAHNFEIFPNPANDYVVIRYPSEFAYAQLTINSINGSVVRSVQVLPNDFEIKINIKDLTKGIYKVTCTDGKKKVSGTLIIK